MKKITQDPLPQPLSLKGEGRPTRITQDPLPQPLSLKGEGRPTRITQDLLPRPLSLKGEGRLTVRLGTWGEVGEQARRIRLEVFVSEQGVPLELEFDSIDPLCVHALASQSGGLFVGTARLLPDGHIGRVAVARQARGQGVGGELLLHLMAAARERGHREVELFAQVNAQRFYERFGFIVVGPQFDDAGIPHVPMRAAL